MLLLGLTLAAMTAPAVLVFENVRHQQQLRQQLGTTTVKSVRFVSFLGTGLDDALDIIDCSDIKR